MAAARLHPAITVSNIKNFIPLTLEINTSHYSSWAELFKIHCQAFDVLDHIIPSTDDSSSTTPSGTNLQTSSADWAKLDAIILSWIYGTLSNELLLNILSPGSTAQQTWDRIKGIFHDNQHSRAVHLATKFANTKLENFSNMSAYCQEMKHIADQLSDVGPKIEDDRLVLQLITGLGDGYDTVGSLLTHSKKLPSFSEARSMLILEETRKAKQSPAINPAALVATAPVPSPRAPAPNQSYNRPSYNRGRQSSNYRGNNRNRGSFRGRGRQPSYSTNPNYINAAQWTYGINTWQNPSWAVPPSPYSTSNWTRPNGNINQPGLLGPRPQYNYAHSVAATATPTDIEEALHTMTLNPPDENWYMDTGATSHMTGNQGNLTSYYPTRSPSRIIVGNGNGLPIFGYGSSNLSINPTRPLYLSNVL
ncbi:uncharacterized protein [Rutidosis leptorrhynchoides]|uniref:uncharacterized protein n=1 Tax=Rutidosis leptorrhynchoides TaxID=125765 RepID=UPI003A9A3D23